MRLSYLKLNLNRTRARLLVLFVLGIFLSTLGVVPVLQAGEPKTVQLQADQVNGLAGASVGVPIKIINPGSTLGVSFDLQYDPNIVAPEMLDNKPRVAAGDVTSLIESKIIESNGATATINVIAIGSTEASTNPSNLCTVYFNLLKNGNSPLNLANVECSAADGIPQLINVVVNGSINVGEVNPTVASPTAEPASKDFSATQNVVLGCTTPGAEIHYTLNGDIPTVASALYSSAAPIVLSQTTTLKAIAIKDGISSSVAEFTYTKTDQCFIATASYGSKFEPSVVLLRQFRDSYLLSNGPGRAFVDFYYHNSPPIAAYIAGNELLKAFVRVLLTPLVGLAYLLLHPRLMYLLLAILLPSLWMYRRKQAAQLESI